MTIKKFVYFLLLIGWVTISPNFLNLSFGQIENRALERWNELSFFRDDGYCISNEDHCINIESFVKDITKIFEDNFIFRVPFIKISNYLDNSFFEIDRVPGFVRGINGWEFYTGDYNLEESGGFREISGYKKKVIIKNIAETIYDVEKTGVLFNILVVPNKASIYQEKLKERFVLKGRWSPADQIFKELSNSSLKKRVTYLKETFKQEKEILPFPIYEKKGSHWNDVGAYLAYKNLAKNIGIDAIPLHSFNMTMEEDYQTLSSWYLPTFGDHGSAESPVLAAVMVEKYNLAKSLPEYFEMTTDNKNGASVLIFGDSFSDKLFPFLVPHFERLIFISSRKVQVSEVKRIKPTVVIHEVAERFFTKVYEQPQEINEHLDYFNEQFQFDDYFYIDMSNSVERSNLRKTVLLKSLQPTSIIYRKIITVKKPFLKLPISPKVKNLEFDLDVSEKDGIKINLQGEWKLLPKSKGSIGDGAILFVQLNGFEAKVSFYDTQIFVGSAVADIPIKNINTYEVRDIELSVKKGFARLVINGENLISWPLQNSSHRNVIGFGDFSRKLAENYKFDLENFEITTID